MEKTLDAEIIDFTSVADSVLAEMADLQLALIGGGMGETVL